MKPSSSASSLAIRRKSIFSQCRGMTLAEVMVAMGLFAIVATGIAGTLIQVRKMAESNLSQITAEAVAEGIIEQVQFIKYTDLSDTTPPIAPVPLKFIASSTSNKAVVQEIDVAWAPDSTTFTDVGETNGAGVVLGVLLDLDYRDSSGNLIRPKRYMKMKVNMVRQIDLSAGNVTITLTYKWALSDRGSASAPVYQTREIRTVKSKTASY